MNTLAGFGASLAASVQQLEPGLQRCIDTPASVQSILGARLDLEPVACAVHAVDAMQYFSGVGSAVDLLHAYRAARAAAPFEEDQAGLGGQLDGFAHFHLEDLLHAGQRALTPDEARAIAEFVSGLDLYAAVRSVECLLNDAADRALLTVASARGWQIHFDHLAIRCGSEERSDAARVVQLLTRTHGYARPQLPAQAEYRFDDGWNALPVYKMLENGTLLRLFVDESARGWKRQIIQHWNRLYGFTAHHLALRATRAGPGGGREAVPLAEIIEALRASGVAVLKPTGEYSFGLLEQVFTRPRAVTGIPADVLAGLAALDPQLPAAVCNGKLTELVSRREMSFRTACRYFALYGLDATDQCGPRSAPVYNYFLPAQAAHVIRTSVRTAAG